MHTSASRRLLYIAFEVANTLNYTTPYLVQDSNNRRTNIPSWRYSYFYAYILVKFSEGHPTALAPGLLSGVGGLGLALSRHVAWHTRSAPPSWDPTVDGVVVNNRTLDVSSQVGQSPIVYRPKRLYQDFYSSCQVHHTVS